jgi:arylsulfatase A-like enzyme
LNRPNVVLLTIDTLRLDRLGCYGFGSKLTPNIDQLASKSIIFTQAITGGSWTQAAFPVLLTSTRASMYGGCIGPLSQERPSPIERIAENGYATAGFTTNPLLGKTYGYQRGFHHFEDLVPGDQDPVLRKLKGGQTLLRSPLTHYFSQLFGIPSKPARVYSCAADLTDRICKWVKDKKEPYFVWVHYMDVHWPYHLEEDFQRPERIAQSWRDMSDLHQINWKGKRITDTQQKRFIELYERALRYLDKQVGRLLHFLQESDPDRENIVILVSDHGEEFLEHGRWGHWETNLHDEILKVPLIIHLPSRKDSQIVGQQVSTIDVMPTILDLCGIKEFSGLIGQSLVPLWSGEEDRYQDTVAISEMWRENRHIIAARTQNYKYIWDSRDPDLPELYDLIADPRELQNIRDQWPEIIKDFHVHVGNTLAQMSRTGQEVLSPSPDMDGAMVSRLRDLGYIE